MEKTLIKMKKESEKVVIESLAVYVSILTMERIDDIIKNDDMKPIAEEAYNEYFIFVNRAMKEGFSLGQKKVSELITKI